MKQNLLKTFGLKAAMMMAMIAAAITGAWADTKTDVLNQDFTEVKGTSYTEFSNKTATSGAVYAGQCAGGNTSIQLRSNNNNSGVVTTTSGGKVKSITVEWNNSTANGRTLNVYGKNSAYSAATDLYNNSKQGTLLGTIVKGTSTSLTVDDDYQYIGFRSASGAMYLTSVTIVWEIDGGGDTPTPEEKKDCDLALTDAPISLSFDTYNNSTAQVINYTTSSTGEVWVEAGAYDVSCSVDQDTKTITVTPLAVTDGEQTVTVNQAADDNYEAGSVTFTVTVTDSTPADNPDPQPQDGNEETITFSENGYANGKEVTEVKGTDCTITFDKGTNNNNAPKYYTSGTAVRAYGGNTFTVSSDNSITKIVLTFGSDDGSNAITVDQGTYSDGKWTGDATSVTFTIGGTSGNRRIASIKVTYAATDPSDTRAATTTTIDATDITNTNVFNGTAAGQLTATVAAGETTIDNAAITWSGNNDDVATIAAGGTVTLVGAGEVTFTATYAGDETNYKSSSATYTLTVVNTDPKAPGTENNPYTVAEAIAAIDAGTGTTGVYAKGIVSEIVTAYDSQYGNITYNISADGSTDGNQLQAYRGKSYNGKNFTREDDIQVGDEVVIYGNLKKYNSTYEFNQNNQLVSLNRSEKQEAGLSFGETTSVEANIGAAFTAPTLTNPNQLTVTYSSDNVELATVDENTGEVTIGNTVGNVTITAAFAGNDEFKAGSVSYTINIIDPNNQPTYYALVAEYNGKHYAMNDNGGATWGATEVDAVNGKVVNGKSDELSWTINEYVSYTSFKNKKSGKYLCHKSSETDFTYTNNGDNHKWTANAEHDTWTNQNGKTVRTMLYNGTGFKNYATSNANGKGYSDYTHKYTFADGYTRDVTAGNWGTFCADHTIAAEDYSGVTFYSIAGKIVNAEDAPTNIVLTEVAGELTAGVAYIFKVNEKANKLVAAYSEESAEAPIATNGLVGSFTRTDVDKGMYLLSGGKVVKCGTGCNIAANRAYIDMSQVPVVDTSAAGVKLGIGDITVGIDGIQSNGTTGSIYNIAGQRMSKLQRGLNIVDGKKVLVK